MSRPLESVRLTFDVLEGAFKGHYDADLAADFTSTEHGEVRRVLGDSLLSLVFQAGRDQVPPPLEVFTAIVWLTRRQGSQQAKALAFDAVGDQVRWSFIDITDEADEESSPEA